MLIGEPQELITLDRIRWPGCHWFLELTPWALVSKTLAKSVTVIDHGAHALRISFAPTGSMNTPETTRHFITVSGALTPGGLTGSNQITLNGRMKDIYISNATAAQTVNYQIYAEITNIASGEMLTPTGSGVSD